MASPSRPKYNNLCGEVQTTWMSRRMAAPVVVRSHVIRPVTLPLPSCLRANSCSRVSCSALKGKYSGLYLRSHVSSHSPSTHKPTNTSQVDVRFRRRPLMLETARQSRCGGGHGEEVFAASLPSSARRAHPLSPSSTQNGPRGQGSFSAFLLIIRPLPACDMMICVLVILVQQSLYRHRLNTSTQSSGFPCS